MGDNGDDTTRGPQSLSGRKVQKSAPADDTADDLRLVRSEEEAAKLRVDSGIKASQAYRARALARSPLARAIGLKP